MKAITSIENTENAQKPITKAWLAHFVIFALLFGAWLMVQLAK